MASDTQILASQVAAAPLDYTLPGNAELLLKAVNASFTDNGATGDWLPAVVLLSDSGHVIARAVDPGVKVTAGDDAEVSWFPGVKPAAAASTGGLVYGIAVTASPYNIPATGGAPTAATTWAQFDASAAGTFTWPSSGDSTKIGVVAGLYGFTYTPSPVATWPAPANGYITFYVNGVAYGTGFQGESRFLNTTTSALFAGVGSRRNVTWGFINLPAADELQLFAGNATVGNFAVSITSMLLVRLGANIPGTVI